MEQTNNNVIIEKHSSERIYLYDNIKFFTILLVVIGHAIDFITDQSNNTFERSLFLTIYSIHMPLFIFISGLFLKPMNKSTKFPKQKVISFILIGISMRILITILNLLIGNGIEYSVFNMYDSLTWFMGAMAVFISILWLFREYDTKILFLFSVLIGCMAGYDDFLGDKLSLMRIFVFLPFFVLGYMIKPEQLSNLFLDKRIKFISAIVTAGFILLFFINTDMYFLRQMFTGRNSFHFLDDLYCNGFLIRLLCYLISAVFGFAVMSLISSKNLNFISFAGTKTLQIYFWHKVFLIILERFKVYKIISSVTNDIAATLIYILIAVGITLICTLPVFSFPTKQLLEFGRDK